MKNIQKIWFKSGISFKAAVLIGIALLAVLAIAPKKFDVSFADGGSCTNSMVPVFNPYSPPSVSPGNCQDYPFLSARVRSANGSVTNYGTSSVQAQPGDKVEINIFIDNGAAAGAPALTNTRLTTNAALGSGSSHNVSASVTASNASNSLSGNLGINIPSGDTLQVDTSASPFKTGDWFQVVSPMGNLGNIVNTTTSLPDQAPCFPYVRHIFMVFDVVAPTPPTPSVPSGTISATLGGQIGTQCLQNGYISWSTTNVTHAEVDVLGTESQAQDMSEALQGNSVVAPWIQPKIPYTFTLYSIDSSGNKTKLDSAVITGNITCGSTPTVTPTLNLSLNSNTFCVYSKGDGTNQTPTYTVQGSSDLANQPIFWSSTLDATQANQGQTSTGEHLAGYGQFLDGNAHWSQTTPQPWPLSDIGYWTKTVSVVEGSKIVATSKPFSFQVKDCSQNTPATPTLNLSLNSSTFCVYSKGDGTNQTPTYTVQGSSDLANQPIFWSSTLDATQANQGQTSTGEHLAGYGQFLDGNAHWSQTTPQPWPLSDIGYWTKTVSVVEGSKIVATSKPFSFQVKDCSQNPVFSPVTCSISPSAILVGQSATFSASQGNNTNYSWTVNGGSITSSSQKSFSSLFNSAGTYTGTVTSNGTNASCNLVVTQAACVSNTGAVLTATPAIKQGSTYSTTLAWSSNGNNQIKITQINPGSSAEIPVITGSASGQITVTGLQGGSNYIFKMYDVVCGGLLTTVQLLTPSNPGQLVCSANVSTANVGDDVTFTATGGQSPYTWATSNNSNAGSGSVFLVNFASGGNKIITVSSSDGQSASCGVVINSPVTTTTGGNCNNDSNSCNNNTNNNNQTSTGNNSSNQNNQNNINGNDNTVTNTNNNCVNNSCNNYYITSTGNTVPANQYSQLSITKSVSNSYGGGFQNSVSANNGDQVNFEIVVTNTGSATANNVNVRDNLPSGLSFLYNNSGNFQSGSYNIGNLAPGQSSTLNYSATVNGSSGSSIQNTATASSDNAGTVSASAWVFINGGVLGGNVNLSYSKTAFNNTKNVNAASVAASLGDSITYTLTVTNNGNTPANSFIITDDLSQVLPYASITDNGGGSVSGNSISYPGITVPAGGSVSRSFQVQVKSSLASNLSYTMTNTYGNTVSVRINTPQVLGAFTAPTTGADTNAYVFSGMLTAAAAVFKKRKSLLGLVFN